MKLTAVIHNRNLRKKRVRAKISSGTSTCPRLSVFISHKHITAQLIDDLEQTTIAFASTVNNKSIKAGTMTEKAEMIGKEIAVKAKLAKIKQIVFDRNGRLYHGRIKALAEAARREGLKF